MINLRDKSLGTSFINLTYFKFACGDKNPLKFVNLHKYYDHDCSMIWGKIHGIHVSLLFDSGAVTTLMDEEVHKVLKRKLGSLVSSKKLLVGVDGGDLFLLGEVDAVITIDNVQLPFRVKVARNLASDVIIGTHFLEQYKVNILFESNSIDIKHAKLRIPMEGETSSTDSYIGLKRNVQTRRCHRKDQLNRVYADMENYQDDNCSQDLNQSFYEEHNIANCWEGRCRDQRTQEFYENVWYQNYGKTEHEEL